MNRINMFRSFLIVACAGFAGVLVHAQANAPALPKPDADGFVSLFNGKDLTGWVGLDGYWSVKDDAITGAETRENSKQTFLILEASKNDPAKFANFELRLKYRFVTPTGNSGIQFRSKMMDGATFRVGGYQADIDGGRQYDGGLYDEGGQAGGRAIMARRGFKTTWDASNVRKNEALAKSPAELMPLIKPTGEWNDMILVADGNRITLTINGELMGETIDESPKAVKDGMIALQLHSNFTMTIQAKDIKIKFLEAKKS